MANVLDINGIKESIRANLAAANTIGGSPIDLSNGMSNRVKTISKVNPEKLMMLGNELPAVTCHTTNKTIELRTIAGDLEQGMRKAVVTIQVAGLVWEPYTTVNTEDPADNELELLMENVERVLRAHPTLDGTVKWNAPQSVQYFAVSFDEETHFRVGLMDVECHQFY